ncbi:MAG: glycerophosphodiester phosphodiesterase [Peptostreptococcaceae bacterium]
MGKMKLLWLEEKPIAHRGLFNSKYPENSLSAFENAIKNNYGIELDVQFTKDKKVVVFHDDNLERMTKDKRNVNELTYEELRKIKLLNSNESIPLLEDVLLLVNGKAPLIIEIKNCKNIIELGEETNKILKNYKGKFAVESFNPIVIEWFKNNAKDVVRGQLSGNFKKYEGDLKFYEKFALTYLLLNFKSKPDFIAYELEWLPNIRVSYLKKRGMPIIAWTVKSEKDMEKAYKYSDNIIFDSFLPNKGMIIK